MNVSLHDAAVDGDDRAIQLAPNLINVNTRNADGHTPLHLSCLHGHVTFSKEIVRAGASPNVKDFDGKTPLHYAVSGGDAAIVKHLLEWGAAADIADRAGSLPVDYCGQNQLIRRMVVDGVTRDSLGKILRDFTQSGKPDLEDVKFLIEAGANLNIQDVRGWSALIRASIDGRFELVKTLCASNRAVIDLQANGGRTALIWAAIKGHLDIVSLLLSHGPSLEIKDKIDRRATALYYALIHAQGDPATSPHMAIADELRQAGANVEAEDGEGRRPIHWFSGIGKHAVVSWLIRSKTNVNFKNGDSLTPLMVCATSDQNSGDVCATMKMLLDNGADSEIRKTVNKGGFTALSLAAMHNRLEQAKILVAAGANVNTMGSYGWTPLAEACSRGFPTFAKLMLDHGAYANTRNQKENTPLSLACMDGRVRCVELLLKHGAKPSPRNEELRTPLYLAARTVRADVLQLLLDNGADVNAREEKGYTALSRVAMDEAHHTDRLPCVELLLKHGADPSLGNKDGWTPMDEAAFRGHNRLIKAFLRVGVDPNTPNSVPGIFEGTTPLFRAARAGRLETCKLLVEEGGADATIVDQQGKSVMSYACDAPTKDYLRRLLG